MQQHLVGCRPFAAFLGELHVEGDRLGVELGEIEAALLDHDKVLEAARERVHDQLADLVDDPVNGQLRGQDLGALLNGAVRSLEVATTLLGAAEGGAGGGQGAAGAWVGDLWRRADKANRLLRMYVESGRDRYLDRIGSQLEEVVAWWPAPTTSACRCSTTSPKGSQAVPGPTWRQS